MASVRPPTDDKFHFFLCRSAATTDRHPPITDNMTEEEPLYYESNTCIDDMTLWSPLPQPSSSERYRYIPYNQVEPTYFPPLSRLPKDTLCWVLKSKGQRHKKKKRENNNHNDDDDFNNLVDNGIDTIRMEKKEVAPLSRNGSCSSATSRSELFMRARVVSDDEKKLDTCRRILVRYPKGSTYRVKRSNLVPVLEAGVITDKIVLVIPETCIYRRAAVVHTCVGECFLEVGCDYGLTVNRVRKALTKVANVPKLNEENGMEPTVVTESLSQDGKKCCCLGIDKSQESIDIAMNRYPDCCFSLEDALTKEGFTKLWLKCQETLFSANPSVVAVDINGNRDLPAVLTCLENLMNFDNSDWQLPRLVIVKSRLLYAQVCNNQQKMGLEC